MDLDVDRGTCPSCGSGDVLLVVHGLPGPGVIERPDVRFAGCLALGDDPDRECALCGTTWTAPPG